MKALLTHRTEAQEELSTRGISELVESVGTTGDASRPLVVARRHQGAQTEPDKQRQDLWRKFGNAQVRPRRCLRLVCGADSCPGTAC